MEVLTQEGKTVVVLQPEDLATAISFMVGSAYPQFRNGYQMKIEVPREERTVIIEKIESPAEPKTDQP